MAPTPCPQWPTGSLVLAKNPLIYFRFNEPLFTPATPLLTSANAGSWGAAAAANLEPNVTTAANGSPLLRLSGREQRIVFERIEEFLGS